LVPHLKQKPPKPRDKIEIKASTFRSILIQMLNEQDLITKDYAKRIQKLIFENDVPLLFNDKIKQEQKEWIKLRNTEKSISA